MQDWSLDESSGSELTSVLEMRMLDSVNERVDDSNLLLCGSLIRVFPHLGICECFFACLFGIC